MKVKDLIELLEEENPKAKLFLEFEGRGLAIDDLDIESSDAVVVLKLLEE